MAMGRMADAATMAAVTPAPPPPAVLEEATVDGIHAAFRDGSLTAVRLVEHCLARIEAIDRRGPSLRSFLAVHPGALAQAAHCDAAWRAGRGFLGPLHGIPVVLKDNFDTHDLPTTGGCVALRDWQPAADAFVVERIRRAGAILLGKTNLQELARGGVSISSLGGQVRNPYDLTRTAGGSSGGTGAALAANLAVLGTGSDTGQSIRSPASACSLVGVRPTRGLVSRRGLMPNSFTQDEAGPMARTVRDAALLLDVMAGEDPQDPVTLLGAARPPARCAQSLDAHALRGARIGLLANLQGGEPRHAEVNRVMEQVVRTMQEQGATVLRFEVPGYEALADDVSTDRHEAAAAFERYLAAAGGRAPVRSFRALVEMRVASPWIQQALEAELALERGMDDPAYRRRMANRGKLRELVQRHMERHRLDAILYPLQRVPVAPVGQPDQPERNGVLSHGTGFPAVTFPAGFTGPTATAPLGLPVGAELLGPDFSEARLLSLAYAFEQVARVRRPPTGL